MSLTLKDSQAIIADDISEEEWLILCTQLDNNTLEKIIFFHVRIDDDANFGVFCESLTKANVEIELALRHVRLSQENKNKLKITSEANKLLKVTGSTFANTDKPSIKKDIDFWWPILSGFTVALGITAVALALTVLNTATLGTLGLVIAVAGISLIAGGFTMFALPSRSSDDHPVNSCSFGIV